MSAISKTSGDTSRFQKKPRGPQGLQQRGSGGIGGLCATPGKKASAVKFGDLCVAKNINGRDCNTFASWCYGRAKARAIHAGMDEGDAKD
eukprot:1027027-Pyramimonas_sp.AAC.1